MLALSTFPSKRKNGLSACRGLLSLCVLYSLLKTKSSLCTGKCQHDGSDSGSVSNCIHRQFARQTTRLTHRVRLAHLPPSPCSLTGDLSYANQSLRASGIDTSLLMSLRVSDLWDRKNYHPSTYTLTPTHLKTACAGSVLLLLGATCVVWALFGEKRWRNSYSQDDELGACEDKAQMWGDDTTGTAEFAPGISTLPNQHPQLLRVVAANPTHSHINTNTDTHIHRRQVTQRSPQAPVLGLVHLQQRVVVCRGGSVHAGMYMCVRTRTGVLTRARLCICACRCRCVCGC